MIEMTFDQPLATLAVEGVVTVLVVPEPPKCPECRGLGVVGWRVNVGSALVPVMSHPMCLRCVGDGLARWPADVTIRSTTKEPEITNGGAWDVWRHMDGGFALVRDRHFVQFLPLGEVVGSVTVEAAVPITPMDYDSLAFWPGIDTQIDLAGQLAFQDFPPGHTALILGGETDD